MATELSETNSRDPRAARYSTSWFSSARFSATGQRDNGFAALRCDGGDPAPNRIYRDFQRFRRRTRDQSSNRRSRCRFPMSGGCASATNTPMRSLQVEF